MLNKRYKRLTTNEIILIENTSIGDKVISYNGTVLEGYICCYGDGKVRAGFLSGEQRIDGIYYDILIHFYNNGKFQEGELSRGQVIEGVFYGQRTYINYSYDGSFSKSGLANSFYCR